MSSTKITYPGSSLPSFQELKRPLNQQNRFFQLMRSKKDLDNQHCIAFKRSRKNSNFFFDRELKNDDNSAVEDTKEDISYVPSYDIDEFDDTETSVSLSGFGSSFHNDTQPEDNSISEGLSTMVSPIAPPRGSSGHSVASSSNLVAQRTLLFDNSTLHGFFTSEKSLQVGSYCIIRVTEDQWEKTKPIWIAQVKEFGDKTLKVVWLDCSHWTKTWYAYDKHQRLYSIPRGSVIWWTNDVNKVFTSRQNLTRGLVSLIKSEYNDVEVDASEDRSSLNEFLERGISHEDAESAESWIECVETGSLNEFQVMLCLKSSTLCWESFAFQ